MSEEESDAKEYWTDLITWQDQRADKDFLQSLPEQKCISSFNTDDKSLLLQSALGLQSTLATVLSRYFGS